MVTKAERDANVMKVTKAWMAANGMGAGAASAAKQPFHAADSEFEATRRTVGLDPHNMNGALRGAFERAKSNPDNPYRNSPNPFRKLTPQEMWIAGALKDAEDRKTGVSPRANHFPREQRVETYMAYTPAQANLFGFKVPIPFASHSAYVVKDPMTGEAIVMRGGPEWDKGNPFPYLRAKTGDWTASKDYPAVTYEQKIGNEKSTIDEKRRLLNTLMDANNQDNIGYTGYVNSNSTAHSAAEAASRVRPTSPEGIWVPGWKTDTRNWKEEDEKRLEERAAKTPWYLP